MPALPYWLWPGDGRPTREIDSEITEELQLHLDLLAEEHERSGLARDDAKRQAAERFGDFDSILRRCRVEKQGDVPMLKRVQATLIGLLLAAVVFMGWQQWAMATRAEATWRIMDGISGRLSDISDRLHLLEPPKPQPVAPRWRSTGNATQGAYQAVPSSAGEQHFTDSFEPIGTLHDPEHYSIVKKRRPKADLFGTALGADREPIAGADVLLIVKTWPNNRFRQNDYAVKTDESGAFVLKGRIPLDGQYGVNAVVVAEGHAIASQYVLVEDPAGEPPEKLKFELGESTSTRLIVTDSDGAPLAKALVAPSGRVDENDNETLVYHQGSNPAWKKTDADGVVFVDWFAPGDLGKVSIRPRGGEWQEKKFDVTEGGTVEVTVED